MIVATRHVLALDPGGSKCEAVLVREDGVVLGWGRAHRPGQSGRSPSIIAEAAEQALAWSEQRSAELHVVTYRHSRLKPLGPPDELLLAHAGTIAHQRSSEYEAALALVNERHGIVAIAGTGSAVVGQTPEGRVSWVDGLGPVLGDGGSGFRIGRDALRAAARALQRASYTTTLKNRVLDACRSLAVDGALDGGCPSLVSTSGSHECLPLRIGQLVEFSLRPHDRSVIASLAGVVNEEANAGDRVAIGILQAAAHEMADAVRDLLLQMEVDGESYVLVGVGGVAMSSDVYWEHFCAAIRRLGLRMRVKRPSLPLAAGNALLALGRLAASSFPEIRRNFLESAPAFLKASPWHLCDT